MVSFPKISPNLLLGVGGIIAAVLLVSQIRKAGADVVGALPTVDEGLRQSITDIAGSLAATTKQVSDITTGFTEFQKSTGEQFTQFQTDAGTNLKSVTDFFSGLFKTQPSSELPPAPIPDEIQRVAPEDVDRLCPCGAITETQNGITFSTCKSCVEPQPDFSGTTVIQPIPEDRPLTLAEFTPSPEPVLTPTIESLLPSEQIFIGGGESFIGGTIRENPIDTLSEVLNLFPELSASQAADFLAEFSGISPTNALRIDPDISNIVANIEGVNVPVENISISDLEAEAQRAAEFTCKTFGLNCDLVDGMMA